MPFHNELYYFLSRLKFLEECKELRELTDYAKDQIETLKFELRFLITFFKFISRDENFKGVLATIKTQIYRAGNRLFYLNVGSSNGDRAAMKDIACNLLHKIKPSWSIITNCCRLATTTSSSPISYSHYTPVPDNLVAELMDDLVNNFTDLSISKVHNFHLPDTVKRQVEALKGNLRFLRCFFNYVTMRGTDYEEITDLLTHTRSVASEAAYLFYACLVEEMSPQTAFDMNFQFCNLLRMIKPIKPDVRHIYIQVLKDSSSSGSSVLSPTMNEHATVGFIGSLLEFIPELLNRKASDMISLRDHMTMLQVEFRFLNDFFMDFPGSCTDPAVYGNHDLMRSIEAVTRESSSAIFSLFDEEIEGNISWQMNIMLSDLLEKLKLIRGEIKHMFLELSKALRDNLPRIGGLEFIEFLLGNLKELLCFRTDSIVMLKQEIETIGRELESLASEMARQNNEHEGMSNLWTRMVDVAYRAEYAIDSFLVKSNPRWYYVLLLSDVIEEIQLIKGDIMKIKGKKTDETSVIDIMQPPTSNALSLQANVGSDGELVVGFIPETNKLIERLIRGPRRQDIVSIVGMSGLGKTTLAKKLYNHPSVTSAFHICIWCYVSPLYQKRKLLLKILSYLVDPKDIDQKRDDEDLAKMVYQSLRRKKYLIVLDDIWNIKAWDDLRMSFPNDNNGSRVIFTTQLHDVAKADSDPHFLRPFNNHESWILLCKIVFKQQRCPSELEQIGKKIAESCRGVPLAVSLIAGPLVNTDKKEDWEQIEKNLSSQVVDDRKLLCMRIAGLGYKHLPNHLKSCFLYFGAFTHDPDVSVQKLIWLWIAEGFVKKSEMQSLEEAAEGYLNDLICRSLVKIAKYKSIGGVKTCQVHDLVRDFCTAKAEEENLLHLVKLPCPESPDEFIDYGVDANAAYHSTPTTYVHYRVCIYSKRKQLILSRPSGPRARSLLFFATAAKNPLCDYDASIIFKNFKLLRVIDLGSSKVGDFPTGQELLVHLRYLSMGMNTNMIPPAISDLWNLETIIIKGYRGEMVLPDTIWKMAKLRHLHVNDRVIFGSNNQGEAKLENSHRLDNLETVSTPCLQYGKNTENILRNIPNVRKMKCIFLDSWGTIENWETKKECNRFPKLDLLSQLESLKVFYHGEVWLQPCEFSFPSNLKKLTLSKFRLPWNEISTIGNLLPNLEVLKLLFKAFEGPKWDMIDGEFSNLKYLELDNLDFSAWNASIDPFPSLRTLILRTCKQLKEVPSSFGDIPMLERIELHWCSCSAAKSVQKIEHAQKKLGNEVLHFSILPQDWISKPYSEEM